MPPSPHCLLLHQNADWFCSVQPPYLGFLGREVVKRVYTCLVYGYFGCFVTCLVFIHQHGIAKRCGFFHQRALFLCQHDNFQIIKHRMMKLDNWCIVQKSRPSSNFSVIPPSVALRCVVLFLCRWKQRLLSSFLFSLMHGRSESI